jgi:hypothetical protein
MPIVVPVYKRQTNSTLAGFNTSLVNSMEDILSKDSNCLAVSAISE